MIKICIIIPFFGSYPEYLYYFLLCTLYNSGIYWLLLTDQEKPKYCPENVTYCYLSTRDFNKLASEKLGFPVEINTAYKLCDFKPAYGLIFEDLIKDYEFWGYCDIDILFGDIIKFLPISKLKKSDVVSTYKRYISGSFSLFRNTDKINTLFRMSPDYKSILQDKEYNGFDENIPRNEIQGFSFNKLIYFSLFVLVSIIKLKFYSFSFSEFRYQFQWYYKKISVRKEIPLDMTEIIFWHSKYRNLKLFFTPIMLSDSYFNRIGKKKWSILWKDGKLSNQMNGREIFGFHFRESKKNMDFEVHSLDPFVNGFSLSKTGINNER